MAAAAPRLCPGTGAEGTRSQLDGQRSTGRLDHPATERLRGGPAAPPPGWGPGTGLIPHRGHTRLRSTGSSERCRAAPLSAHSMGRLCLMALSLLPKGFT